MIGPFWALWRIINLGLGYLAHYGREDFWALVAEFGLRNWAYVLD